MSCVNHMSTFMNHFKSSNFFVYKDEFETLKIWKLNTFYSISFNIIIYKKIIKKMFG